MLSTLQIVALLQGVFLLTVLVWKRKSYKKPVLWLLSGAIASILFFIIGDDANNLFAENVDWFFFDISLFITFLFLFVKYYVSGSNSFNRKDLFYFIPNLLYFFIEISEVLNTSLEELLPLDILELLVELTFLGYLFLTIKELFTSKKQRWMLYVIFPLTLLLSTSIVNDVLGWFDFPEIEIFSDAAFATYTLIIVAFIFYYISIKLIISPKEVLLASEVEKYKSSGLNENLVETYKNKLISFMEIDEGYKDCKLSLTVLSQKLAIPKQYISEILNVHLNTNFQDFVNGYRVDAFADSVQKDQYAHLTFTGIANEVGFNSKSSFYATFKKHRGLTPSEFKKSLSLDK
jgi:AraC-like DNA-binding protein